MYLVGGGVGLTLVVLIKVPKLLKPCPLVSEKLAFGCALFSNVESDTGMIQKTIIASTADLGLFAKN